MGVLGVEAMKVHLLTNNVSVSEHSVATTNVTCESLNSVGLNSNKTPKKLRRLTATKRS
jgi:hypothetical protein